MQEGVRRRRNGRGLMFLKCWRMLAVAAAVLALSGIVAGCGAVGGRKKQKPFDVQYLTYFGYRNQHYHLRRGRGAVC